MVVVKVKGRSSPCNRHSDDREKAPWNDLIKRKIHDSSTLHKLSIVLLITPAQTVIPSVSSVQARLTAEQA